MMQPPNSMRLGKIAGLSIRAKPSALIGSVLLWVVLSAVGLLLKFSIPEAIVAGLIAVLLHWAFDICHQFGHAWAARSTGYPMVGIVLWWVLTGSEYPSDEPANLPKSVHARRALGGPIASLLLGGMLSVLLLLIPVGTLAWWLALFAVFDNIFVLGLGAFLPLGFTDGSTLLSLYKSPGS